MLRFVLLGLPGFAVPFYPSLYTARTASAVSRELGSLVSFTSFSATGVLLGSEPFDVATSFAPRGRSWLIGAIFQFFFSWSQIWMTLAGECELQMHR